MKRFLLPAIVVSLGLMTCKQAFAQTAACQSATVQLNASGTASLPDALSYTPQLDIDVFPSNGAPINVDFWQSFTPTVSGLLDRITVNVPSLTAPTGISLTIYSGQGIGGTVLHTQAIPSLIVGANALNIAATVDLIAGNTYTFRVNCTGGSFALQRNNGDIYADGISSIGATTDIIFSTRMLQRPSIDNGSTSVTGIASFAISQNTFDCEDLGGNSVTLTVTAKGGGTDNCVSTVTVEDNIFPTATCVPTSPATPYSDSYAVSNPEAIPDNFPAGLSQTVNVPDNGVITGMTVFVDAAHTFVGDLIVTLQSPGGQTITLIDRIGVPNSTFGCGGDNIIVTLNDAAATAIEDATCGSPVIGTYIPEQPLASFIGENAQGTWTLTISDNANLDVGTLNAWTLNIDMELSGTFISLPLDVNGDATLTLNDVDNGSFDNCSFTRSLSQTAFDCSHVGVNTVTLSVQDDAGNTSTCDVLVDVIDNTLPDAICQDVTIYLDASGDASIDFTDIDNGSDDACGIALMTLDQEDFDCSHIGDNTVTLTVEDVNGNISTCTATVTVVDDEFPIFTFCPGNQVLCATDGSGAVVTYADPTGSDNCDFTITQTDLSGLSSGSVFPVGTTTIEYTITDDGGNTEICTFDITVDAKPVAGYTFSPACVGEAMFFNSTSTIQGGYNIVSHTWDFGDGSGPVTQVNPIYQYTVAGDFDVTLTVVSADGCTDQITQTVTVTPGPLADFTADAVCLGQQTEFVNTTFIDPGYTGNVNYTWNFGDGSPASNDSDPIHTYATSGTFTVTLTAVSDNGCTNVIQKPVVVSALPQSQFTASSVCVGNATQFNDLSFGTGLSYDWDFGDSETSDVQNPTHTYAADGTFSATLTVTAPGGCQSSITNTVTVIALPTVDFSFTNACEGIEINFVNASDAGNYGWDFGDNTFSILTNPIKSYPNAGTYDVTLTVTSPQSCINSATQQVEIFANPQFDIETTDALCFDGSTGTLFVDPIPPVTDNWQLSLNGNAFQTNVFSYNGLTAGTYTVDVLDDNGCVNTGTATIGQPAAPLALDAPQLTDLLCNGDNTGSLEIAAAGGTAPYSYAINGGTPQASGLFSGLAADDYFVEVVDDNGCSESTLFFTISEPDVLALLLSSSDDLICNGDNSGQVEVAAVGGTAPYVYNVNGGDFGPDATFIGLPAGDHVIMVRDDNGCETPLDVTLTQPGALQASVLSSTSALCTGQSTGTVTVSGASGTAPYQYSLDGVNFQGSGLFQGLAAGSYTLTVRDANNCLTTVGHQVAEPSQLEMATASSPVLCFGQSTGTITVSSSGGTSPYSYSYDGGSTFFNQAFAGSLASGTYLVVVRDVNGCEVSQSVDVSEASTLLVLTATPTSVSCLGGSNGGVQLTAAGGTPTYAYSANGVVFQTSNSFGNLSAGSYTYTVQDIHGCQAQATVEVSEPPTAVIIDQLLTNAPGCGNLTNGAITVQASGGTPGYTYSANGVDFQQSGLLGNLGAGTYTVTVQDANGCTASESATLTAPPAPVIVVNSTSGVECAGTFTGSINVSGEGGTPGYTFSLSGGAPQTSGQFSELTNGVYIVQMSDVNGCSTSTEVELTALYPVPAADFNWVIAGDAVWFENLSEFGDTYLWDFGDGTTSTEENPVHFYATPGYYTVTLSVTNGCGTRTRTRAVNTLNIGIEDDAAEGFSIYPNPASTELFITAATDISGSVAIEVTSVSGQRVMTTSQNGISAGGRFALDVSGLGQGMYLLNLQTEEGRSVIRFIVTR